MSIEKVQVLTRWEFYEGTEQHGELFAGDREQF